MKTTKPEIKFQLLPPNFIFGILFIFSTILLVMKMLGDQHITWLIVFCPMIAYLGLIIIQIVIVLTVIAIAFIVALVLVYLDKR